VSDLRHTLFTCCNTSHLSLHLVAYVDEGLALAKSLSGVLHCLIIFLLLVLLKLNLLPSNVDLDLLAQVAIHDDVLVDANAEIVGNKPPKVFGQQIRESVEDGGARVREGLGPFRPCIIQSALTMLFLLICISRSLTGGAERGNCDCLQEAPQQDCDIQEHACLARGDKNAPATNASGNRIQEEKNNHANTITSCLQMPLGTVWNDSMYTRAAL
jgi:hypothetical protein